MTMNTTEPLGLAKAYAMPATFAGTTESAAILPTSPEQSSGAIDSNLREGVLLCGMLKGVMDNAVTTARTAARTHLMATLNLACVLRTMHQQAAGKFAVLALYKNYRGAARAQEYALQLTGGASLPFTYQTGRNYIKVLESVETRMQIEGGLSPAQVAQVLADHTAAMVNGAYDDPLAATEAMWTPYLTAGSLREAYLELAPDKPMRTLRETIEAAEGAEHAADDFETVRSAFLSKCGGYFDKLDSYLVETAPRVRREDRELVADKLEEAARKLRSMTTMPSIPSSAAIPALLNS